MSQAAPAEHKLSLVVATYNRPGSLLKLLCDLDHQSLAKDQFEVIVVDDGSKQPAIEFTAHLQVGYSLKVIRQANQGRVTARNTGIAASAHDIIVLTDDDMQFEPQFLEAHQKAHQQGATLVFGHIKWPSHVAKMPVYEQFHDKNLQKSYEGFRTGQIPLDGFRLCSGNVSFRKEQFHQAGGFDPNLASNEDRDLGIALEKIGARITFAPDAVSIHYSDHSSLTGWLTGAFRYGIFDEKIEKKYPELTTADPLFMSFYRPSLSHHIFYLALYLPGLARILATLTLWLAVGFDMVQLKSIAHSVTGLAFGLAYYAGVRSEMASYVALDKRLVQFRHKCRQYEQPEEKTSVQSLDDHSDPHKDGGQNHASEGDSQPTKIKPVS